jgi:hypothetical protein
MEREARTDFPGFAFVILLRAFRIGFAPLREMMWCLMVFSQRRKEDRKAQRQASQLAFRSGIV